MDIDTVRRLATTELDQSRRAELGQYTTPSAIADFMAGWLTLADGAARLLDAGAGVGSLTFAAASRLPFARIDAWEIDPVMRGHLERTLAALAAPSVVHAEDFVLSAAAFLSENGACFSHAILNPPYRKISSASPHRQALDALGVGTVNLYAGFVALAVAMTRQGGEIVAIVPRSFCNGPYYRSFREYVLSNCAVEALHLFDSRRATFKEDGVLQENVIVKLRKGGIQKDVAVSRSEDATFADTEFRDVPFAEIVRPGDSGLFIRIPSGAPVLPSSRFVTLADLGLSVSTGPVVDYRVADDWMDSADGGIPLVYPHHLGKTGFSHPVEGRKPNGLRASASNEKQAYAKGDYVLVNRISLKESKRRIVATHFRGAVFPQDKVCFENRLNVFHAGKRGIDPDLCAGLAAFLNSEEADREFRLFSGNTQVNATDLRALSYPTLTELLAMGRQVHVAAARAA